MENLFLTEPRREILEGSTDWADSSIANEKSRIRARARLALAELIEVAESDEIDNADIFESGDIFDLLEALFGEQDDIPPYWEAWDESDEAIKEYQEEYRYERALVQSISTVVTLYEDRLLAMRKPSHLDRDGDTGGIIDPGE